MSDILALILAAVIVGLVVVSSKEHAPQYPLVEAGYSVRCDPVPGGPIVKNKPVLTYQRQRGIA